MPDSEQRDIPAFSAVTAIPAEGARVGLVICNRCGAAILVDPRDTRDRCTQHELWHEARA